MAYATQADYEKYGDGLIEEGALSKRLERASDEIDSLTFNRIVARGFDNLTDFQQKNIKKAVCRHADFNSKYGDFLDVPFAGFGAGSISMSFKTEQDMGGGGVVTSQIVTDLLLATGLSNRRL